MFLPCASDQRRAIEKKKKGGGQEDNPFPLTNHECASMGEGGQM